MIVPSAEKIALSCTFVILLPVAPAIIEVVVFVTVFLFPPIIAAFCQFHFTILLFPPITVDPVAPWFVLPITSACRFIAPLKFRAFVSSLYSNLIRSLFAQLSVIPVKYCTLLWIPHTWTFSLFELAVSWSNRASAILLITTPPVTKSERESTFFTDADIKFVFVLLLIVLEKKTKKSDFFEH